jgi:hypothetical protein
VFVDQGQLLPAMEGLEALLTTLEVDTVAVFIDQTDQNKSK